MMIIVCLCRQGIRVGVLSGPGHCTKSRHRNIRTKSSPVESNVPVPHSHGRIDITKVLDQHINHQVGSTTSV